MLRKAKVEYGCLCRRESSFDQLQTCQRDEFVFDYLEYPLKTRYRKNAPCRGSHVAKDKLMVPVQQRFSEFEQF